MKQGKFYTYLDTTGFNYMQWKNKYREMQLGESDEDANDIPEPTDEEISEYYYECRNEEIKNFFINLSMSEYYNEPCVLIGTIERAYEKYDIIPKYKNQLYGTIKDCVYNKDEYVIRQEDDHLEIEIRHGRDTDHFEIWLLNERGKAVFKNNKAVLFKSDYIRKIEGYLF